MAKRLEYDSSWKTGDIRDNPDDSGGQQRYMGGRWREYDPTRKRLKKRKRAVGSGFGFFPREGV